MDLLESLLLLATLNVVYQVSFFFVSCWLRITHDHYFLGYGKALFAFRVRSVTFSIGWYIPIFLLARIYTVSAEGKKSAMIYPWEFTDRPLWRRWLATWSGVTALIVCAWIVYIVHAVSETDAVITREDLNHYGIDPTDAAKEVGFRAGDKVMRLNGQEYDTYEDLFKPRPNDAVYTIQRGDSVFDITISFEQAMTLMSTSGKFLFSPRVPFRVQRVDPGTPAEAAGVLPGDRITKLDGLPVASLGDLQTLVQKDTGSYAELEIERDESSQKVMLKKTVTWPDSMVDGIAQRRLGIFSEPILPYTYRSRTLFQAVGMGTTYVSKFFTTSMRVTYLMIFPRAQSKLSGPIGIAPAQRTFGQRFTTGALNVWVFNILPLPFTVFWETIALLYEGITRKKYPESVFRWSWIAGLVVFVTFVLFTLVKDLMKLFN
jgi:regulator of sigma E protease